MYISNIDLHRFNEFYRNLDDSHDDYVSIRELTTLKDLFYDDRIFYRFIYMPNEDSDVGHWCVLIKYNEKEYEWFDCAGHGIPHAIQALFGADKTKVKVYHMTEPLMAKDGVICGRWCIFRILCCPHTLEQFLDMLSRVNMPKDDFIKFIINLQK